MRVRARFFASYREIVGTAEVEIDVPSGSTVGEAVSRLRSSGVPFDRLPPAPVVAVNREYASPAHGLQEGDEMAFLPPVAGG